MASFKRDYKVEPNEAQKNTMKRTLRLTAIHCAKENDVICTVDSFQGNQIIARLTIENGQCVASCIVGRNGGLIQSESILNA